MKKRFIVFVLSLTLVFQCLLGLPITSYAYNVNSSDIINGYRIDEIFEYDFLEGNTLAYVIKKYNLANDSSIKQLSIPKKIDNVKVVEIADGAFENAKYLEQVYIPDSVNKIGKNAFYQAISLKSITIPGSVLTVGEKAFYRCVKLEEATILYGVQSLGDAAFGLCINLRTISAGETVDTSDDQTFNGNKNLTIQANENAPLRNYADSKVKKVELPDDSPAAYEYSVDENGEVTIVHYKSDRKNPIIPDNINGNPVSHLAENSFKDTGINSIKLPDTLKTIASNVFVGTNLEEITIPSGITSLGANFIEDKEGLIIKGSSKIVQEYVAGTKHIVFKPYGPESSDYYELEIRINGYGSVTGTKDGYIKSGDKVEIFAIPASGYKFEGWSSNIEGIITDAENPVTTFTMPSANTVITVNFVKQPRPRLVIQNGIVTEFNAYDDLVLADYEKYKDKDVTGIDANAFNRYYGHGNPSGLEIPSSLTNIPLSALEYCSNLKYIKVEAGNSKYKDIDGVLFSADGKTLIKYPSEKDLSEYTVPDGVTTIEMGAFRKCSKLNKIILPSSVTTIKSGAFYGCGNLTEINIPNGVTTIESSTFYECRKLPTIVLPSTINSIGSSAFEYCSSLNNIDIPNGVTIINSSVFSHCTSLTNINIPNSVTTIGMYAFDSCSNLNNIDMPNSITSIGDYAFRYCSSLNNVQIPNSVTVIGSSAFAYCRSLSNIVIAESVTTLGSYIFEYCTSLTEVNIPSNLSSIGSNAFYNCSKLQSINVDEANVNYSSDSGVLYETKANIKLLIYPIARPDTTYTIRSDTVVIASSAFYNCDILTQINLDSASLVTVGNSAFASCDGITTIVLPQNVTTIGSQAFYSCNNLIDVTLLQNVTTIGSQAFYNCSSLENINVDESNQTYTSNGEGILFTHDMSNLLIYPMGKKESSYSVPQSVYKINDYAFSSSKALMDIDISQNVSSIGNYAFEHCNELKNVITSENLSSIGSYAFEYCNQIQNIDIPINVSFIGTGAFSKCSSLESIEFPEKVTTISNYVVSGCNSLKKITINNKNAYINYHTYENERDYSFSGINKSKVIMRGHLDSTAETYAFLFSMQFEQIEEASKGLLVDKRGVLYGYEGTDLDIILSSNIKQIGSDAFKNPNLTSSEIYKQIKTIKFPLSVRTFEPYAFDGCNSITSLNVTRAVYDIRKGAFNGCSNLAEINIASNNTTYKSIGGKNGKGNGVVTNPSGTIIKEVANGFKGPENDGKYTIPSIVTGIESSAFLGCSLSEVTMGNVAKISTGAFRGAFKDGSIKINLSNVKQIENEAFADCTGITDITLPSTLELLGDNVFDGCTNLENIFVKKDNKYFLESNGVLYAYLDTEENYEDDYIPVALIICPMKKASSKEEPLELLDYTVQIYDNAFNNCKNIKYLNLPQDVQIIGQRAFNGCTALENLNLPNNLIEIRAYAFAGNELLGEVTIPKTVQNLAAGAFINCSRLYKVTIYNDNLNFGTEAKIFDEELNQYNKNQLTIYANRNSTSEKYIKGRNITFEPLNENKVKESITLNASGDVNVKAILTSSQAESVMQNVYSNLANEIELNIDTVSNNVYNVITSLPRAFIESFSLIADASNNENITFALTINTPIANISLDKKAIDDIINRANATDVDIIIKNVDLSTLNISSEAIQKIGDRPIIEVNILSGKYIDNLNNGLATISIPYNKLEAEISNLQVVYIYNNAVARQLSNPDSTNTYLVFSTGNLDAKYAISRIN